MCFTGEAPGWYSQGMKTEWIIKSPDDFQLLVQEICGAAVGDRLLLALSGDLGAGKTTFTQQLGALLGVQEPITSPTFTIMRRYETSHKTFTELVHIDAYRFESDSEAQPLALQSVFQESGVICCVEWPERIASVLPDTAWELKFEIEPNETRRVTITLPGTQ